MNMIFAIAAGGAVGALARHFFAHWINSQMVGNFPWGIMLCNILGAFLMGALIEMSALHWSLSQELRAFLAVGILGSFTTFSRYRFTDAKRSVSNDDLICRRFRCWCNHRADACNDVGEAVYIVYYGMMA